MGSRTNPSGRPTRIPFDLKAAQKPVFHALLEARDIFGGDTAALVDGDGRVLTYEEIIRAAFVLGDALKKGARAGENIGVMLPTAWAQPSPSSPSRPTAWCPPCSISPPARPG